MGRDQDDIKLAGREQHPAGTVVAVGRQLIGGGKLAVIAGPCAIESGEQLEVVAAAVQEAGAGFLRGGAYKPRTSPYSFQGLRDEGLDLLVAAGQKYALPIVTEVMNIDKVEEFAAKADIIQVGARNMQNFELLKALGRIKTPVLLKRGFAATIEEWLLSAEYIMQGGNGNVILCERGIRTFEPFTRNTLDLSAVAAVKKLSHLPVLVDPSHGTGVDWLVEPMAKAAIAAGADGIMVEVHPDKERALSDGQQALNLAEFAHLMTEVRKMAAAVGRTI